MDKFVIRLQVDDERTASKSARKYNEAYVTLGFTSATNTTVTTVCCVSQNINFCLTSSYDTTRRRRSPFLRLLTCAKRSRFTETVTVQQHGAAARY